MDLMLILGWGSPIGMGFFLLCIAGMAFILSKVQKKKEK
jgi:formate-dependent nitrite reductase membrane component NrfD